MTAMLALIVSIAVAFLTWVMYREQRQTRMDDKFPCIIVRSRKNPDTSVDELRLVNAGRGPAFITRFVVKGLDKLDGKHEYKDGDHTDEIDRVIGPDMGNLDLQCWFAWGTPANLRSEKVSIGIAYKDTGDRIFESGIIKGKPVWDPPPEFSDSKLCVRLQRLCGKEETSEPVKELRIFLGMATE